MNRSEYQRVTYTFRTVRVFKSDEEGTFSSTVAAVVIADETTGKILQLTFNCWMPKQEALRKAETKYRADKLRVSYGRPMIQSYSTIL